jgi:tetratricopeptide (TPR) repeat protein
VIWRQVHRLCQVDLFPLNALGVSTEMSFKQASQKRHAYLLALFTLFVSASLSGCELLEKMPFLPKGQSASPGAGGASLPDTRKADAKLIKTHLDAGNSKAKAGDWAGATEEFKAVLEADARNVQGHVQIGWAYAEQKMWDEAQSHLISAVALDPNNAGAHANLAWVYAEKKRWADAQEQAKRAIDLDPKNPYPHATLAWAYQSANQPDLAIAEYEKSLELNPNLDNSRVALGIEYCNQGNMTRAKAQLDKLKSLGSSKASEVEARINKGCGKKP